MVYTDDSDRLVATKTSFSVCVTRPLDCTMSSNGKARRIDV